MKAQATIEFLFVFLITLSVISILAGALMSQNNSLRENLDDVKRIADAESAARAIEAWLNTGIKMKFNFYDEDVSYRIEGDSFHMNNHGKLIEIRGIFEDDKYEPL